MNTNRDNALPQDKDRHLDIPSEANRDKHIDFDNTGADEGEATESDDATRERQRRWREGLEAGRKARRGE